MKADARPAITRFDFNMMLSPQPSRTLIPGAHPEFVDLFFRKRLIRFAQIGTFLELLYPILLGFAATGCRKTE